MSGPDAHKSAASELISLEEEKIDLSDQRWDDAIVLILFWVLAVVVFLQFFTRYILNDSIAWTEEVARFLLIGVAFIGSVMATRKQSHIAVEFVYRWIPRAGRRIAQTVIDVLTTGFFIMLAVFSAQIAVRTKQKMVSLDVPKSTIYWIVTAAFVCMALYSAWNTWRHLRTGTSKLIDPELHAEQIRAIDQEHTPVDIIWLFVMLAGMLIFGMPVAVALAGSSAIFILFNGSPPPMVVAHRMINGVDSFPLLAVPFFILAGNLMNTAGITERIFNFALAIVGWMRGGLGHVNIGASVIFAGMSGAAVADAGGLGAIEIKAMRDANYDPKFAVGVTAASSTIGPIIPPSLPMVIYGVVAGASIGQLFVAGFVPGLLMAASLMILVAIIARRRGLGSDQPFYWSVLWSTFQRAFLSLLTPIIIVGGILSGAFTPTEAAVAACAWALFLGLVVYRTLSLPRFLRVSFDTIETTAVVLLVVGSAAIFAWILTSNRVPEQFATGLLAVSDRPWVILLLINLILLAVGCFMETVAAITIMVPVLLPIAVTLGIDPVHFGVIMVLNLMLGLLTPPVGMVLYVLARVAKIPFEQCVVGTAPFLVPLVIVLLMVTFIPSITMFLPTLIYRQIRGGPCADGAFRSGGVI